MWVSGGEVLKVASSLPSLAPWSVWILLILRVVFGLLFVLHGYPKLTKERKQTEKILKKTSIPIAMGPFAGFVELVGGLAILLGLMTSVAALLMALWMMGLTVFSITRLRKPLLTGLQPGYELELLYLMGCLILAALGGGPLSLDGFLGL